jgi:putative protease
VSPADSSAPFVAPISAAGRRIKPELLAPAGDHDCVRAAIENGADAIYFGLQDGWNARARAANFGLDSLPALMAELHRRGVKGYCAFNTLVFENELSAAEERIRSLAEAGVDALIVQDLGVARLARAVSPDLPLHASTQMTISTAEGCEFARRCGVSRAILARELSVADIARIHAATDLELEVFVHGALCVSWSGQCLTSEVWGGRSANRGECAQACRMPYTLDVDGQHRELGAVRYLLSPKDLAAFHLLPELIDAGVRSFKIEGRLKTPEYVAQVTSTYRQAIDQAWKAGRVSLAAREVRDLEQSFSRGLAPGFLGGVNHQQLVEGRNPKKRGVFLGWVADVDAVGRRATVALEAPLAAGDGIVFEGPDPEAGEQGGTVIEVLVGGRPVVGPVAPPVGFESSRVERGGEPFLVELRFLRDPGPDLSQVEVGMRLFKTKDPVLEKRLRESFSGPPRRRVPIEWTVRGRVGAPLVIEARDEEGRCASGTSTMPLIAARNRPLTRTGMAEQLFRLGDTIFRAADGPRSLAFQVEGDVIAPLSELSRLRRELCAELAIARGEGSGWKIEAAGALARLAATKSGAEPGAVAALPAAGEGAERDFELSVLVRNDEQVTAALEAGIERIYLDYLEQVGLSQAVARVRAAGRRALPATTRIAKPGEEPLLANLLSMGGDGVLARHLGALEEVAKRRASGDAAARALELVGDFSLNAANGLTAELLLDHGVDLLTPSFDLNAEQLLALVARVDAARLEVVIHQHLPLFHMEHCVFAHLLSNGADHRTCGRPCERHAIGLKDDKGWLHPVLADVGCRNTLFNHRPQSAAEWLPRFREAGVTRFRVELLRESRVQSRTVIDRYRAALAGNLDAGALFRELNAEGKFGVVGVTRGTLPVVG